MFFRTDVKIHVVSNSTLRVMDPDVVAALLLGDEQGLAILGIRNVHVRTTNSVQITTFPPCPIFSRPASSTLFIDCQYSVGI